ncbi:hypothetical protein CTheo_7818 [Ceratobasidium theobromae]|uniref:FAD-binding PCMH-type domain-containing protein n=1 Tax=Ceratobasidium theobromae TaxID=1582974 RepID=A0A5N5QBF1_9AGAM|nr:hypothetical protein CTheo_7818 [Ceratobasidium theobromae]
MTRIQALLVAPAILSTTLAAESCTADQSCWPSSKTWAFFNSTIAGKLVAPRPAAWPCHDPNYDETACNNVKTNWGNSFWRSNQTGAMQDLAWESMGCDIDTPRNVTCVQGFVPVYSVAAESASDVSKAVKFASQHNLKLVIKNTGHDYLGRSSGEGAFSIWTHKLKGIKFTDSFVSKGCSNAKYGVPAVTLGAAEQWLDVYKAADDHNVTVVGGAARSVGAAGGWVQGGGHSPLGGLYGMGVDNVLQFTVVKASGQVVIANGCQNKDLFWALRGGGGSTWGVTLDVTYKTHPALSSAVALGFQVNTTSPEQLASATATFLENLPNVTDSGVRGYCFWLNSIHSLGCIFLHPNSPSVESTNSTLEPMFTWASQNNGVVVGTFGTTHRTFYDMFTTYITDIGIASASYTGSRLVSRTALTENSKQLAQLSLAHGTPMAVSVNIVGGGAVSKADPESTGLNPQWRKDALLSWMFSGGWNDTTPPEMIELTKQALTNFTQELGQYSGLDQAAYLNEADPREPQWKKAFFGSHYDRLLKIKRAVDPKGLFTCNRCIGSDL